MEPYEAGYLKGVALMLRHQAALLDSRSAQNGSSRDWVIRESVERMRGAALALEHLALGLPAGPPSKSGPPING